MIHRLNVEKKTGFRVLRPEVPVIIRDDRGMLFYSTEDKTPKVTEFNLPKGIYYVESGSFKTMPFPVDYKLMPLPLKERSKPIPRDFTIVWGKNPNKCSIIWPMKTILFDTSLLDYSKAEQDFIKYHEFSHASYLTEKYCDLKAANYMLLKGYNPIQIGLSQIDSLSERNRYRKSFLVSMLLKHFPTYL